MNKPIETGGVFGIQYNICAPMCYSRKIEVSARKKTEMNDHDKGGYTETPELVLMESSQCGARGFLEGFRQGMDDFPRSKLVYQS